tara:strand:- start:110 stop:649 length:540 start_codon:yes stop_codon:yes gene_type:complete
MSMKLTPLLFFEKVKKIITENLIAGANITLTTDTDNKVTIAADARIIAVATALDLTAFATGLPYGGATFSIQQGSGAFAITLPTATSAAEGTALLGWHISIIITSAGSGNVTVVRGDTSNDTISGIVVAGDAAASGITINSNVITFVGGTAVVADRVDITCVAADATNTIYATQGFCAV